MPCDYCIVICVRPCDVMHVSFEHSEKIMHGNYMRTYKFLKFVFVRPEKNLDWYISRLDDCSIAIHVRLHGSWLSIKFLSLSSHVITTVFTPSTFYGTSGPETANFDAVQDITAGRPARFTTERLRGRLCAGHYWSDSSTCHCRLEDFLNVSSQRKCSRC